MAAPKKGVAFTFDLTLIDQANRPNIKLTPTLAAGDFKVSIDGGALANPATLPSESPAGSGIVKVILSAAEMTGDRIALKAHDAAGAEWDDVLVDIFPTLVAVDDGALAAGIAQSVDGTHITFAAGDGAKVPGNSIVTILSATTGAGQSRYVTSVATDTALIDPAWTVTPTGTIVYMVQAAPPATAAVAAELANLDAAVSSRMATFTLPANFATFVIDANGRVDLSKVLGAAINALIAGRVDANAQVVGDKTGYTAATVQDKTGYALTAGERSSIADALLVRKTISGADGSAGAHDRVLDALVAGHLNFAIAAGVLTVKDAAGTAVYTRTLTRQQLDAIIQAA